METHEIRCENCKRVQEFVNGLPCIQCGSWYAVTYEKDDPGYTGNPILTDSAQ